MSRAAARTLTASVCLLCAWPLAVVPIRHYLPRIDNDEIGYFLQIKTFIAHGFSGGNFFLNDQVPLSRIRFGLHGPAFVTIYGLLGRLIGWHNASPYLVNVLWLLSSWLMLQWSLRRSPARQAAVAAFVLANGYFFLFLPSMMEETFHVAVALLMAALWNVALDSGSAAAWSSLFALTVVAAATRYTWMLVLPVFLFAWLRRRYGIELGRPTAFAAAGLIAALVGASATYAMMRLWIFWTAPAGFETASTLLPAASVVRQNLGELLSLHVIQVFALVPVYFRLCCGISLAVFVAAFVLARSTATREAAAYAFVLLALPTAAQVAFYMVDGYRDFRVLAGFHALACITSLSRASWSWTPLQRRTRFAVVTVAAAIVVVNLVLTFDGARSRYDFAWERTEAPRIDRDAQRSMAAMRTAMTFAADETSYCKTVYGPIEVFDDPGLIHLPLGFAFSVIVPTQPDALPALRGKYIIVSDAPTPVRRLVDGSSQWVLLGVFGRYRLYRSRVSCGEQGAA